MGVPHFNTRLFAKDHALTPELTANIRVVTVGSANPGRADTHMQFPTAYRVRQFLNATG